MFYANEAKKSEQEFFASVRRVRTFRIKKRNGVATVSSFSVRFRLSASSALYG